MSTCGFECTAFKISSSNHLGLLLPLECFVSEIMQIWVATFLSKSNFISSYCSNFHQDKVLDCSHRKFYIKFYAIVLTNRIVISFHFHLYVGVSTVDVRSILKSLFAGSFLLKIQ